MTSEITTVVKDYLEDLAEELAINERRYQQAYDSYHSLGEWLNRDASSVKQFNPAVYVQGSFGLGTVIQPLSAAEEYDVDSVCVLKGLTKGHLSQESLKILVGNEIEAYRKSKSMVNPLTEGRRCWTLNYADEAQFHMDIVPAVPDSKNQRLLLEQSGLSSKWVETAIAITDNESSNYSIVDQEWSKSNPKGYLEWFKTRMEVVFTRKRMQLAEAIRADVDDIPEYRVRTPLQSAIMILKRHRDIRFANDTTKSCPISIIITTLAAHAYQGEESVADALYRIIRDMDKYIGFENNRYVISNPSALLENFADKWEHFPERQQAFFRWLAQVRTDFNQAATLVERHRITSSLAPSLGESLTKDAESRRPARSDLLRSATAASAGTVSIPTFGNEPRHPTTPRGFA